MSILLAKTFINQMSDIDNWAEEFKQQTAVNDDDIDNEIDVAKSSYTDDVS